MGVKKTSKTSYTGNEDVCNHTEVQGDKCGDKDEHGGVAGMRVKEGGDMGEEEDGNEKGEDAAEDKAAHDPAVKRQRELRSELNKRQMDESFLEGDTDKDTTHVFHLLLFLCLCSII